MMCTDVQLSEEDVLVNVCFTEIHEAGFDEGQLLQPLQSLDKGEFTEFEYTVGDETVLPLAVDHLQNLDLREYL